MRIYFAGIAELFANAPAAMISHLIAGLSLALFACLMLLQLNKSAQPTHNRRMAVGAGLLLMVQVVQMAFTVFYLKGIALSASSMGMVDHLVIALTAIWVAWLLLGEEQPRKANRITALLSLAVLFLTTFSILLTLVLPGLQAESGNILNLLWYLANLLILVIALILLAVRRPPNWGIGASDPGSHRPEPGIADCGKGQSVRRDGPAAARPGNQPTLAVGASRETG